MTDLSPAQERSVRLALRLGRARLVVEAARVTLTLLGPDHRVDGLRDAVDFYDQRPAGHVLGGQPDGPTS